MSTWTLWDTATGLFRAGTLTASRAQLAANTPPGWAAMEGRFDHLSQRVDTATGDVVPYVPPPPGPTEDYTYVWNEEKQRWVAKPTLMLNKKARKAEVKAAQAALVGQQHDPVRRLVIALGTGGTADSALEKLQDINRQIKDLDDVLAAIDACTTQEELDAIG